MRNADQLKGFFTPVIWKVLIVFFVILFLIFQYFSHFYPFGVSCGEGLDCFPNGNFSSRYMNCGIINERYADMDSLDVKNCIWSSYLSCHEAYARLDRYGIEGQTGVSQFIVVERKDNTSCFVKWYVMDGDNKLPDNICSDNINKTYWRENCDRGKSIRGDCYKDIVTCLDDCPSNYFLSDGVGTSCQ